MPRRIEVITDGYPERPAFDTALSHAVLSEVAAGSRPESLRVHVPARLVAFGRQDSTAPGYSQAVEAAAREGFAAVERLAGGRAAVFHPETLAFAWATPHLDPRTGIRERFEVISAVIAEALRSAGVDARVGEVPGEYCPGAYSVNARGSVKLAGVGQRLRRGAAHVGGVIVVGDATSVERVLVPVYEALEVEWDPATVGAVADEVGGVGTDLMREALLAAFAARFDLVEGSIGPATLQKAAELEDGHRPRRPGFVQSGR